MSEKQTSLLRVFGNRSAPSYESDVDVEGPTTSKTLRDTLRVSLSPITSRWESLVAATQAHGSP